VPDLLTCPAGHGSRSHAGMKHSSPRRDLRAPGGLNWCMPLPSWLARLNRHVTNPALLPLARRLPYFGVVLHRGRSTGRLYRTPVNTFPDRAGYVIALTYGREVDWVKNVIAAGGCRLVHRGRTTTLVGPRILTVRERSHAIPSGIRTLLQNLGVSEVLDLKVARP
jgi:deazaflavin-dependent oxidoreductase (nitroreductase family)